jgi:DNA repair exonuclease SbcCD nuclease subunit
MKPYGIVSDLHFHSWSAFSRPVKPGVGSRLQAIADELVRAAEVLKSEGGDQLYVAGDIFHVRGSIQTEVANVATLAFSEIANMGVGVRAIFGNHDISDRTGNWAGNAVSTLELAGVYCVGGPHYFDDDNVFMIPWVESVKELRKMLGAYGQSHSGADVIMHAPLNGVIRGIPATGLEPSQIEKLGFKRIFSGHYHNHVNFNDRVFSIGATCHQTWSDPGTKAGFLIVTPDAVTHHPTQAPLFVDYDPAHPEMVQGNFVRYKTKASSQTEIAKYRQALEQLGALDVVIHPVPDPNKGQRTNATVQSGASLQQSIGDFVNSYKNYADPSALSAYCLDIMSEVESMR